MTDSEKLKIYTAMTESTRKWVSVMDTKAGFLSALNAALLGFIWTGAKLLEGGGWQKGLAISVTASSLVSLFMALHVVLPRASLKKVFGRHTAYVDGFKPISFYGFVATTYPIGEDHRFLDDIKKLDEAALIDEALEQHFTISHVVQIKSHWLAVAGVLLKISLALTTAALFSKVFFNGK